MGHSRCTIGSSNRMMCDLAGSGIMYEVVAHQRDTLGQSVKLEPVSARVDPDRGKGGAIGGTILQKCWIRRGFNGKVVCRMCG
jgi:hypothetical protein